MAEYYCVAIQGLGPGPGDDNHDERLRLWSALAELCATEFGERNNAIHAYEVVATLRANGDLDRHRQLAELYVQDINRRSATAFSMVRFGNVLGGIRLPEMEAPTASHRGERERDGLPLEWLQGQTTPFTREQLDRRYSSAAERRTAWFGSVEALVKRGVVLPEDADALRNRCP